MLTPTEPRILTRVPAALMTGKSLVERVDTLNAIAAPFADLLVDPLTWEFDGAEFRLETIPYEET